MPVGAGHYQLRTGRPVIAGVIRFRYEVPADLAVPAGNQGHFPWPLTASSRNPQSMKNSQDQTPCLTFHP